MKTYSTHPAAVYWRNRRLQHDDVAERTNAGNRKSRARRHAKKLADATKDREQLLTTNRTGRAANAAKVWLATVARHLSKGRDAGSIAVRENVRVAKVLEAIATLKAQAGGS
jgi:hypothetical protein